MKFGVYESNNSIFHKLVNKGREQHIYPVFSI